MQQETHQRGHRLTSADGGVEVQAFLPFFDCNAQTCQLRGVVGGIDQIFITVSSLSKDELKQRGGPPEGSHFISKPIDLGWLKGYLLGLLSPQGWV